MEIHMMRYIHFVPVIKTGPLETTVVNPEPQRMDKVEFQLCCTAQPGDVSCVGWNLRLVKGDLKAWLFNSTVRVFSYVPFHDGLVKITIPALSVSE